MSGVGHWYIILVLLVIALLVFGPNRLPELGSSLGKAIRRFRETLTTDNEATAQEGSHGDPPEDVAQHRDPPEG